ncbi:MAG: DUF3467 domain-containing protein [Nitrospinota bacterium]
MSPKGPKKPKPGGPEGIEIKITPLVTEDTPYHYCNYVTVTHSPYDFTLSLIKIPTSLKPDQVEAAKKGEPVALEPIIQMVISPRLVPGLIKALNEQKSKYEARFGSLERGD